MPTGTYINQNYEQDLINNLTEGNLFKAFAATFMLDHLPSDIDSSFSNGWGEYYYDRVRNLTCSACKAQFDLSVLFMSTCKHFYCCIYASYLLQKERADPLECSECMAIIEAGDLPAAFMRPV